MLVKVIFRITTENVTFDPIHNFNVINEICVRFNTQFLNKQNTKKERI
jgi:hypothetical protein